MAILKPEVGAPVVLTVTGCRSVKGRYRQEYEFGGQDGVVYVGVEAADRQLSRLHLTPDTVIGKTLEFVKVEKDGKKYLDINFASGAKGNGTGGATSVATGAVGHKAPAETGAAPTTQPRPVPRADVERVLDAEPAEKKPTGYALYKQITAQVLKDMPVLYKGAGVELDAQAIAAITATLFIQASRNGH